MGPPERRLLVTIHKLEKDKPMTTDIIPGLQAIIDNSEGRLYDHEREYLRTVVLHIQGLRAVAGKASGEGSYRETVTGVQRGIPRTGNSPISSSDEPKTTA